MADAKISQLQDGSPAQPLDQIPVNRAGTNFRVNAGSLPSLAVQVQQVQISSAQLLALKGSPQALIAAPGAGKFIVVFAATFQYRFGTVAYNLNNGGWLCIGPAGTEQQDAFVSLDSHGILDQVKNTIAFSALQTSNGYRPNFENAAINIANGVAASEWTGGDGTLVVTVFYAVVALL